MPLYQRTLVDLKAANDAARLRKELSGRQAAAPKTLAETKQAKENQPHRIDYNLMLDTLSFDEMQKRMQDQQRQLTAATELRTKLSEQVDTREKRRKELPQLISEARSKVEAVEREQAATPTPASVDPLLKEATTWSQMAQKMTVSEQAQLLEQEQRVYEAETELLPLQLELARADEKHLQDQVRKLTEGLDRLRQEGIAKQRQEVRQLVEEIPKDASTPVELHKLGLQLMERINQWLELVKKKAEITNELAGSKTLLDKWKDRYTKMVNRVETQPARMWSRDSIAGSVSCSANSEVNCPILRNWSGRYATTSKRPKRSMPCCSSWKTRYSRSIHGAMTVAAISPPTHSCPATSRSCEAMSMAICVRPTIGSWRKTKS